MTTVTTSAVLRAEALGWSVDGKTILSGVSVDVRPQMMTMIIGLNGSGKT
ncbi:histidinol phosphatase, partial [Pseudomonas sp. FW305-3-2-15-A-R2A1]